MPISDPAHWKEPFYSGKAGSPKFDKVAEIISALNALEGKGVTGGDAHDHDGGDGAQIDHTKLSNIGTNNHAAIDTHLAAVAPHSGHALSTHYHFPQAKDQIVWRLNLSNYSNLEDYSLAHPHCDSFENWSAANNSMRCDTGVYQSTNESPVDSKSLRWYRNVAGGTWSIMLPVRLPPAGQMILDWRTDYATLRGNCVNFWFLYQKTNDSTLRLYNAFQQDIFDGTTLRLTANPNTIKSVSLTANTWYNLKVKWQWAKGTAGNNRGMVNGAIDDSWGTSQYFSYPSAEDVELRWLGLLYIQFTYNNSSASYYMDTFYDNWRFLVGTFNDSQI